MLYYIYNELIHSHKLALYPLFKSYSPVGYHPLLAMNHCEFVAMKSWPLREAAAISREGTAVSSSPARTRRPRSGAGNSDYNHQQ